MLWPVQFGKVSAAGRVQGSETAKMKCQEKSREYRRTKRQLACPVSNHVDFVAVYRR